MKSAGIDLKIGKKATSSPEEATRHKQSPSKRPKPQPELFPYGPGYELIDAAILESLTDAELGKACQSDKYVETICNDNEFWRKRLEKRFGYEGNLPKMAKHNYRKMYKNTVPYLNQSWILLTNIIKYGYEDLFKLEYKLLSRELSEDVFQRRLIRSVNRALDEIEPKDDTTVLAHVIGLLKNDQDIINSVIRTGYVNLLKNSIIDLSIAGDDDILYSAIFSKNPDMVKFVLKTIKSRNKSFVPTIEHLSSAIKEGIKDYEPSYLQTLDPNPILIEKLLVAVIPKIKKAELTKLIGLATKAKSAKHIVYFYELGATIPKSSYSLPNVLAIISHDPTIALSTFKEIMGSFKLTEDQFTDILSSAVWGQNHAVAEYLFAHTDEITSEPIDKKSLADAYLPRVVSMGMSGFLKMLLPYERDVDYTDLINRALYSKMELIYEKRDKNDQSHVDMLRFLISRGGKMPPFIKDIAKL